MSATDLPTRFSEQARYILHPTDFSPESELAFAHALRLALANKANLTLLHVGDHTDEEWDSFPPVRATLERWGYLEAGSRRADIAKLGIGIDKIIIRSSSVTNAIADHAKTRQVDMLVLATDQRHELSRLLQPSVAEKAARKAALPALFVPTRGRSCINLDDGTVTMDHVLVPVNHEPPSGDAVDRGLRAITMFGNDQSKLTMLYVGSESRFPSIRVPDGPWSVTRSVREGEPVTEILAAADETAANVIIMVTNGTDGFLEGLRGSTTEQVLRKAPCPVLSIPADY